MSFNCLKTLMKLLMSFPLVQDWIILKRNQKSIKYMWFKENQLKIIQNLDFFSIWDNLIFCFLIWNPSENDLVVFKHVIRSSFNCLKIIMKLFKSFEVILYYVNWRKNENHLKIHDIYKNLLKMMQNLDFFSIWENMIFCFLI